MNAVNLVPGLRDAFNAVQQQVYCTRVGGAAAGNRTITGISKKDVILAVIPLPRRRVSVIAGDVAGNHTLTGIGTSDRLEAVHDVDTTSGVLVDLTGEFTIDSANTIDNTGGTASTRLVIYWDDLGPGDLTSEFSITADDTINNAGGTASTDHILLVFWAEG